MLARYPKDSDGTWPHPAVCEAIEKYHCRELAAAFLVGVQNKRGMTTRGVFEGGGQERTLADRYLNWSQIHLTRWPRTAAILRKLASEYHHDAQSEDERAERRKLQP